MRIHLAFALALAACTGSGSSTPEETELQAKRTQFTQNMTGSYQFQWRQSCECSQDATAPMLITVTNGAISDAIYIETELPVPAGIREHLDTIDGVFDRIQDAIDEDAHMIYVEYDAQLGFPKSVAIDYSEQIADEELSLVISNVEPLAETCGVRPCG